MPTVVQIGAGSIGRGFLGQLWCEAGYETVFVDVSAELVAAINERGSYPLYLVGTDTEETRTIFPCRAVLASDTEAVRHELAQCAFAATAVGARHIESAALDLIAPALSHRITPLNVLLCENGLTIRDDFRRGLGENAEQVGAVETVIARMVPVVTGLTDEPLMVSAEPYYQLPFNRGQWLGEVPEVPGLIAVPNSDFPAYELHKLYIHNGGHAVLAYQGYLKGYEYIWQCAEDVTLVAELHGYWQEIITAFTRSRYGKIPAFTLEKLTASTDYLLGRFRNRHLGDTVARVARDPIRKLAHNDRLVGAGCFCLQEKVEPIYVARAIAAALHYSDEDDPSAVNLQELIATGSPLSALQHLGAKPLPKQLLVLVEEAYRTYVLNL